MSEDSHAILKRERRCPRAYPARTFVSLSHHCNTILITVLPLPLIIFVKRYFILHLLISSLTKKQLLDKTNLSFFFLIYKFLHSLASL